MKVWTHKKVRDIAKKCKHRSELQEKWSGAFKYAKRNGLMDELFPELFPNRNEPNLWNYNQCKKVSKQYKTLTKLKSEHVGAYNAILRYGWLDDFYPNRLKHKPDFDYSTLTYDKCKKIASKYESPSKLMEEDRPVYKFSSENDWLCDFYPNYIKPHPKRSYEDCKELIGEYEYLKDFTKNESGAYSTIISNKWHDLLKNLKRKQKPKGYWTYEKCREHALKHTEREKLNESCKHFIYKNGWYDLFDHMVKQPTLADRYIYVFEFEDNYAYVGLTYNPDKRKSDHFSTTNSPVRTHFEETNSKYVFKILTESLGMIDSSKWERKYIKEYQDNGWILLNKNKGGCLGSKSKYTYKQCKDKVSEYVKLKDFTIEASGYYNRIKKEKWVELLEPLERYKNYIGSYEYYVDRYPKIIDLIKKNIPNCKIVDITGCSKSVVCNVKKILKVNGQMPSKDELFMMRPQSVKTIELLKLKYHWVDIVKEVKTSSNSISKAIKLHYEKTGVNLYYSNK